MKSITIQHKTEKKEKDGMSKEYDKLLRCYHSVREKISFEPQVALILGSGLGDYAEQVQVEAVLDYHDIEGFPVSTVLGHKGRFVFGYIQNVPVVIMQGRVHFYEGYDMHDVVLPTRLMGMLGAKVLFLTNAAGGMQKGMHAGDFMLITGHISSFVPSPLVGPNIEELGTRFPDMSEAYSKELIDKALEIAKEKGIKVQQGVYIGTQGPTFETPAEYKMFHILGADAVGMSTVPEVIVANHCGIKVFGVSVITDLGVEGKIVEVSHEEVQKAADEAQPRMTTIMREMINRI